MATTFYADINFDKVCQYTCIILLHVMSAMLGVLNFRYVVFTAPVTTSVALNIGFL